MTYVKQKSIKFFGNPVLSPLETAVSEIATIIEKAFPEDAKQLTQRLVEARELQAQKRIEAQERLTQNEIAVQEQKLKKEVDSSEFIKASSPFTRMDPSDPDRFNPEAKGFQLNIADVTANQKEKISPEERIPEEVFMVERRFPVQRTTIVGGS